LRILIDAEPKELSFAGDVWGARIARLLADPLLPCRPGQNAAATPDSQTPDRLVLSPREGVRSAEIGNAIAERRGRGRLAEIDRVELAGGRVRIYLRRESARLMGTLCEIRIPGTGQFRLAQPFAHGRPIELARVSGDGIPEIELLVETDPARALGRLRHGEAEILGRLPESYWPEQAEAPMTRQSFAPVRTAGTRLSYLIWNLRRPPASEPALRAALSLTLDRTRWAPLLHHGLAELAEPGFRYDPAAAAAALEAAGWRDTGSVRQREGKLLRLTLLVAHGEHASALAGLWKEQLARIGVELSASIADGAGFLARLREGSYDCALLERPTPPGADLSPILHSRGSENFGGIAAPAIDALLAQLARGAADEATVWQAALAESALVPLFRRSEVALVARSLAGIVPADDWIDLAGARWQR
jgi:hypothetical protein